MKKSISLLLIISLLLPFLINTTSYAEVSEKISSEDVFSFFKEEPDGAIDGDSEGELVNYPQVDSDYTRPRLAVTGNDIWHIYDGMILCADAQKEEETAALPLPYLYREEDELLYADISCWDDENVLLCLCLRDELEQIHIKLFQLNQDDDEISFVAENDATSALGFLFDGKTIWEEVNLISFGQHIVFEALDESLRMQLYLYDSDADSVRHLGAWSLIDYIASVPCNENLILVSRDIENSDHIILSRISCSDGSEEQIGSVNITAAASASNFAYNTEEDKLFFSINNTVYAAALGDETTPDAVAALTAPSIEVRLGAIAGNRFVALGEEHALLFCNTNGNLELTELHIADYQGTDAVYEASQRYGLENHGYTVFVSTDRSEEEILKSISEGSSEYDAFVLTLNADSYRSLLANHHLADLSDSEVLFSAAQDMPDYLRPALFDGESLLAFPVSALTYCQTINVNAMQELLGLSGERNPSDWEGFLKLLRKMASKNTMGNQEKYSLYGMEISAEEFSVMMFTWLIQDTFLWLEQDHSRIDSLQKTLTPVLEAYSRVDWYRLGLLPEDTLYDEDAETIPLSENISDYVLMDGELEAAVIDMEEGVEFWPLSIGNNARLIPQIVYVICVNPYSENLDAALKFVETVWENTDVATKTALCQSMNSPALNPDYDDDLEYMEDLASTYETQIENAEDPVEKQVLANELEELSTFIEDYRENGYWLITEDSIAFYRAFQENFVLSSDEVYGMEDEDSICWKFLMGELSPKQFAKQLAIEVKAMWGE